MRPKLVETHLAFADDFVSTLRICATRQRVDAVGSAAQPSALKTLKTLHRPRSLHKHLLLRRGSRLAHHKCLVDLDKLQDSRRDDYNYAMSRHAVHALVHRCRFFSS